MAQVYVTLSKLAVAAATDPDFSRDEMYADLMICLRQLDTLKLNIPGLLVGTVLKQLELRTGDERRPGDEEEGGTEAA